VRATCWGILRARTWFRKFERNMLSENAQSSDETSGLWKGFWIILKSAPPYFGCDSCVKSDCLSVPSKAFLKGNNNTVPIDQRVIEATSIFFLIVESPSYFCCNSSVKSDCSRTCRESKVQWEPLQPSGPWQIEIPNIYDCKILKQKSSSWLLKVLLSSVATCLPSRIVFLYLPKHFWKETTTPFR